MLAMDKSVAADNLFITLERGCLSLHVASRTYLLEPQYPSMSCVRARVALVLLAALLPLSWLDQLDAQVSGYVQPRENLLMGFCLTGQSSLSCLGCSEDFLMVWRATMMRRMLAGGCQADVEK